MPAILTLTGPAAGDINLNDGTSYALAQGWTPAVAPMRRSRLAGGGPYADVREDIPLRVFGSSAPNALAALRALVDAADQATRWKAGEEITPVLLNYRMSGSGLGTNLSVPVWGTVDEASLRLSPTFNEDINAYEISPVILRLRRPGQWFGAAETPSATAAQTHPNVFSVTFGSNQQRRLMPLDLSFSGFSGSYDAVPNPVGSAALLLVADAANKINKFEAESMTATAAGFGTFNTAADSAASGGNIRRLQPTSAGTYTLTASVNIAAKTALYHLIAVVRNNSATINYSVQLELRTLDVTFPVFSQTYPAVIVDTSTTNPRLLQLPPAVYENKISEVRLNIVPSATSGSGNQLDVDVCVFLHQATPADQILALRNINRGQLLEPNTLALTGRVLTRTKPAAIMFPGNAAQYQVSHRGDPYLLTTGNAVAACLVGTTGSHWRIVNGQIGSSPTAVSSTLTATRRLAYRVPQ